MPPVRHYKVPQATQVGNVGAIQLFQQCDLVCVETGQRLCGPKIVSNLTLSRSCGETKGAREE
jgi:hypothetical protein